MEKSTLNKEPKVIFIILAITTFGKFQEFIDMNFPNVCLTDQVRMYRDCYSLGLGNIPADVFFTIARETNFFLGLI